jgi:hypothetical protein
MDLKTSYGGFERGAQNFFRQCRKRANGNFLALIVVGPYQTGKQRGEWMLEELFELAPKRVQCIMMNGMIKGYEFPDRLVLIDYTRRKLEVTVGGKKLQTWIPCWEF